MPSNWIALFRGINVGGNNILPMAKLKHHFQNLRCTDIRTYIQSGNVVFRTSGKSKTNFQKKLLGAIEADVGFRPQLLLLDIDDLQVAVDQNPFAEIAMDPKSMHYYFLAEEPAAPDLPAMESIQKSTESWELRSKVFYLHAPEGIGRSKLAAKAESLLNVTATARNGRTVTKLLEMAQADA